LTLSDLREQPFELLVELERRARAAVAAREGRSQEGEEWVGVGFRLGAESFVVDRSDVREVLPVPDLLIRVPGTKGWLRGIANVRGQLLTVVDLKAFLGGGVSMTARGARVLVVASRDVPTGLMVDEVVGFRRFNTSDLEGEAPATLIRCEAYLGGSYRHGAEVWPCFDFQKLVADEQFLLAGEALEA